MNSPGSINARRRRGKRAAVEAPSADAQNFADAAADIGRSPDARYSRQAASRWVRRAGIIAAVGLVGSGLSLGLTRLSIEHGRGITIRVPPAAQSAAVVQSLPPPDLLKPLSPDQATKENSDRPFVARSDSPARKFVLHTDAEDRQRAVTCLAQAVYYEAAGEGVDGGRAVAQVVLNRLRHPGFPSTVCGVVYEGSDRTTGCQFSFTCDGSMRRIPAAALWSRSRKIAEEALKGRVFAPVGHATHYHADYVLPYWADSLDKSVQIGRHIFYRLRSVFGDARAFSQRYAGTEPPFHEPGATIQIPETPEGQELANKLMGAPLTEADKKTPPAPAKPATPLIIDAAPSTLLADDGSQVEASHRSKPPKDCVTAEDRANQLGPLKANDMRSEVSHSTC